MIDLKVQRWLYRGPWHDPHEHWYVSGGTRIVNSPFVVDEAWSPAPGLPLHGAEFQHHDNIGYSILVWWVDSRTMALFAVDDLDITAEAMLQASRNVFPEIWQRWPDLTLAGQNA